MKKGFWQNLPRPFWALAPMEDVTDTVFRQIVASVGRPHVFYTEFTNVDGIMSRGSDEVTKRLKHTQTERPLVAQLWGNNPENFKKSAQLVSKMGFDGIDINFGCPVKSIARQDACSALIGNEPLVGEIITATIEGAGELPVSVKTRIGRKKIITDEWIGFLLSFPLAVITVHGRTAAEMSKVPAHWDEIGAAVALRNAAKSETLIIGNGDVKTLSDAREKVEKWEVDGVMIGRGIFENVSVFSERELSAQSKLDLLAKHVNLFMDTWGQTRHFPILKKFIKAYVNGFPGAAELRAHLMEAQTAVDLTEAIQNSTIKE